ncbi:MAG: DUF3737 family protein [Lachnospiraceae bacterium]|nr:DUF3737 family protein [Lachnospiraceae bacterium]
MEIIKGKSFDEERALYGSDGVRAEDCRFDGPADGESAFKESRNIEAANCYFNLRYPFWHDDNLSIEGCEMTDKCRAALWYSKGIRIRDTKMHGIKALRECANVTIEGTDIISPEFGWSVSGIAMKASQAQSEYFMMRSDHLTFDGVKLQGKYSFQYITDSVFTNCNFDTKDSFWHAKNVIVKDSIINGEYLAWYCENVTFENCIISGTQPLCYCKGLKLINCKMKNADLAFEKSEVDAEITNKMISIKNPKSGIIRVRGVQETIMDDPEAKGIIEITG